MDNQENTQFSVENNLYVRPLTLVEELIEQRLYKLENSNDLLKSYKKSDTVY